MEVQVMILFSKEPRFLRSLFVFCSSQVSSLGDHIQDLNSTSGKLPALSIRNAFPTSFSQFISFKNCLKFSSFKKSLQVKLTPLWLFCVTSATMCTATFTLHGLESGSLNTHWHASPRSVVSSPLTGKHCFKISIVWIWWSCMAHF